MRTYLYYGEGAGRWIYLVIPRKKIIEFGKYKNQPEDVIVQCETFD